jgi:hypothetical protein
MSRLPWIAAVALAGSCGSMSSSRQHVEFARLSFDVPGDWHHSDNIFKGVSTSVWTPEANDDKESITVIRSEIAPALEHASESQLASLLQRAQNFAAARVSTAVATTTPSGFSGARVEVDYVPPGLHERYHRVHVVLLDGASVIHVMYTAKHADPKFTALNTVLGTIREEG